MVDSKRDASTAWRDMENFNLIPPTARARCSGSGFGHPLVEKVKLPDVTAAYELEPYVPHNSVLGLWAFGGLLGLLAPVGGLPGGDVLHRPGLPVGAALRWNG